MKENNESYQDETIYISDSSENESAENTLYRFSNIIKYIGFVIGGICVAAGFIGLINDEASFLGFLVAILLGVVICFLFVVCASAIKVFANISMSLKDITKLLNR